MAGDWIKVQHVTPDKPEIVAMANDLGIDQDSAFGKCMRIWIWADQQTISGDDLSVTSSFLDRLTNCPGFSAALLKVGWLKGRNGRLLIPNFDRHNGQTAKNRALTKDRMKRQRDGQIVTESSLEKRREEKKEESPKPPSGFQKARPTLCKLLGIENPTMRDDNALFEFWQHLHTKKSDSRDLALRIGRYRERFKGLPVTMRALMNNWHSLEPEPEKRPKVPEVELLPDSLLEDADG